MRKLLEHLQAISLEHGASLTCGASLRPLMIERCATRGEYSRGVLSTIAEVYFLLGDTPEGRQAIADLGFQPLFQNTKGE